METGNIDIENKQRPNSPNQKYYTVAFGLNRFNLSNHLVRLITDSLNFKGLNDRIEACDFSVKQKIQASFSF